MKKLDNKIEEPNINLNVEQRASEVFGMFQTVTTIPTETPRNWFNQIQIYSNGGTTTLYIYDTVANTWLATTLT